MALATLPRDRWGPLGLYPEGSKRTGPAKEGWVWSDAVTLPADGCQVVLNADHARLMRVEVSDAEFNLLPRFSGDNSGVTEAEGGLDCEVGFSTGDLSGLGGKTVRFRVHLRREGKEADPRLYAVYLRVPRLFQAASLFLPEAEGVQIRILHDRAQPLWPAGKVVQRLQEPSWIIRR